MINAFIEGSVEVVFPSRPREFVVLPVEDVGDWISLYLDYDLRPSPTKVQAIYVLALRFPPRLAGRRGPPHRHQAVIRDYCWRTVRRTQEKGCTSVAS